jgi:hypothetical protein
VADTTYFRTRRQGGGTVRDTVTGQMQPFIFGKGGLPARTRVFTHGTGNNQVNKVHFAQRTLNAATTESLDLAGGLTDYKGAAITLTALKYVYIAIVSADGAKSLRIGPQNVANAAALGWGGVGATVYETITTDWELYQPYTGHTITPGTGDLFPVHNPGASAVTYALLVMGVG